MPDGNSHGNPALESAEAANDCSHILYYQKENETNIKLNKLQTFLSWLYIMHLPSKASEPKHINLTVT